jgi:bifunctional ADP-heptose synthase (sugar kinase/adenylyltransferase)
MKDAKRPSWKTTEMGVSSFSLSSDDVEDVTGAGEEVISLFEPARALKERGAAGQGHILRAYS